MAPIFESVRRQLWDSNNCVFIAINEARAVLGDAPLPCRASLVKLMISSERGIHKERLGPEKMKHLLRLCEPGQPFTPGPACHALGMQTNYPVLLKYAPGDYGDKAQIRLGADVPAGGGDVDTLVFEVSPGGEAGELGHLTFMGKLRMSSTRLLTTSCPAEPYDGSVADFASMPCGMKKSEIGRAHV